MIGYYHLFIFCVLLPVLAVISSRRMMTAVFPPKRKYFASVVFQQIFFGGFSVWVAMNERIELFAAPQNLARSALIGVLVLAAMIAFMYPRWRRNVEKRERRLYFFMPRTPGERAGWSFISLLAGVSEEITYRGVVFMLLARLTGSLLAGALVGGAIFAFCHYLQGWQSILAIFAFALVFQAMVYLTGSLFVAMAVHFLYDVTAGMTYSFFGDKLGYPIDGIAPEEAVAKAD
jgi:membrane protease YdiL (CAAX protease family)